MAGVVSGVKGKAAGRRIGPAALLLTSALGVGIAPPALAQSSAQASQTRSFDIPAGSLADALVAFGLQSGMQVAADGSLTAAARSPGVTGSFVPLEALSRLLAGTGLTFRVTSTGAVQLERAPQSASGAIELGPVRVEGAAQAGVYVPPQAQIGTLPPPYAGGQVARGGQVGILGNKDMLDTPFSETSFTAELIENQQAISIGAVLRNDPAVQTQLSAESGIENFAVRGFDLVGSSMMFNGLTGIAPTGSSMMMTEGVERVEILRGPNALLNGATPNGGIGGTVNIIPKHAGDAALTKVTGSFFAASQLGGHIDFGRRLGTQGAIGIRVNGVYRSGNTNIDHNSQESGLAAVGLDYRSDRVRLSLDAGYQDIEVEGTRRIFLVAGGVTAVPAPPKTDLNANQPWEVNHAKAFYGALRGELDLSSNVTAFAAVGGIEQRLQLGFTTRQITDSAGSLAPTIAISNARKAPAFSAQLGVRAEFETGPIHHRAVVSYDWYDGKLHQLAVVAGSIPASNIYSPTFVPAPATPIPDPGAAPKLSSTKMPSATLADTLSILEDRVQLTVGARFQSIESTSFNTATGAIAEVYDKKATTPVAALVIRPAEHVSVYANYIEGLQQGSTAPTTAANAGEVFAPFVSKQYEAGVKLDFENVAATFAAYQLAQPNAFVDPTTNIFGIDGEERHRGIEVSVFGEPVKGVRLFTGASFIDAKLTKTNGGINEGNRATIPRFQFSLSGEWDVPVLTDVTLTSSLTHAASQYLNQANTQKIPGWTQWDAGARWSLGTAGGMPITIRADVVNVLGSRAWLGSYLPGQLNARSPRTLKLSASLDF